jgi:hypothetical protein
MSGLVSGDIESLSDLVSGDIERCLIGALEIYKRHIRFQELLDAVDGRSWQHLSKRRVQHYGFEFQYEVI